MAKVKACRVCLATNVPLKIISDTPLQLVYEKLTDSHLTESNKPSKLCYICYSRLQQAYKFTAKAVKANFVLDRMIKTGAMVSHFHFDSAMSKLNRKLYDIVPLTFTRTQTITLDPEYSEYPEPSNNHVIAVGDSDAAVNPIKIEVSVDFDDCQDPNDQEQSDSECDPLANVRLTSVMTIKEESSKEEFLKKQSSKEGFSKEESPKEELLKEKSSKKFELETQTGNKRKTPVRKRSVPRPVKRTVKQKKKRKVKLDPSDNRNRKLVQINEIMREIRIPLKQQKTEFEQRALSKKSGYKYNCDICYSWFTNTKTLAKHRLTHNKPSGPYYVIGPDSQPTFFGKFSLPELPEFD